MLNDNDEVMFFTLFQDKVILGTGKVKGFGINIIYINCKHGVKTVEKTNVFPYDNDTYTKLSDAGNYHAAIETVNRMEIDRLHQICDDEKSRISTEKFLKETTDEQLMITENTLWDLCKVKGINKDHQIFEGSIAIIQKLRDDLKKLRDELKY